MISNGQLLGEIKSIKAEVQSLTTMLHHLVTGLRSDNRDLLDRLLARSAGEYAALSQGAGNEIVYPNIDARMLAREDQFSQEHLAGTVIEDAS